MISLKERAETVRKGDKIRLPTIASTWLIELYSGDVVNRVPVITEAWICKITSSVNLGGFL